MASRRRRFRTRPKPQIKRSPANDEIKAPEVRLVGIDGAQLGVVTIEEARQQAAEVESDLVMVAEKANPPVVRIMDLGKHMYEKQKKDAKQKAKSKSGEIKGIRIGFKMGQHDWEIRLRQADAFLQEGNKVKLEMRLRGREKGRVDMAQRKMQEFVAMVPGGAQTEGNLSRSHNSISGVIMRSKTAPVRPATDAEEEE